MGGNEATGEIVAETLTENSVDDASQVAPLLAQIDNEVKALSGDGCYDKHKVFEVLTDPPQQDPIQALIALRKDAKINSTAIAKRRRWLVMRSCDPFEKRAETVGNNKVDIIDARWQRRRCFAISRSSEIN